MDKRKYIIILVVVAAIYACSTSKPSYTLQKYRMTEAKDSAVIVGFIKNINGRTLPCFFIEVNDSSTYKAECDGKVKFKLQPGQYSLTGSFVGYEPVKTKEYTINSGDSLLFSFYLPFDTMIHKMNIQDDSTKIK